MIQNQWNVACASVQLKSEPFSTQLGETKIVLFRDQNQKACALLDRCRHRGFPLSKGKMENGRIACGYHGWQFEGSGQCESFRPKRQINPFRNPIA
jgi:phenylpropionate dioxygenase-like ring-hydroxylating dioxygenase large terminal subunit